MKIVKMTLDSDSITKAMKELTDYAEGKGKGTLDNVIEQKMQRVVDAAVNAAVKHYKSSSTTVRGYRLTDNVWVIEAIGDQVTFLEFGAGFYANHGYAGEAKDLGFQVYSGSWSEDHARQWQQWVGEKRDPRKFPYNRKPRRGMHYAVLAAKSTLRRMSR